MAKVKPIADVIAAVRSNRSLEQMAADTGGKVHAQAWGRYLRPGYDWSRPPAPEAIVALAEGAHITVRSAWLSFGASIGLDVGEDESELLALMPARTSKLKPRHLRIIRDLIIQALEDADREDELERLRSEQAHPAGR
jgi:hypothetical protein